ncbi:MAG: ATP synthase F1 subunit gamma [Oscillospiraceae bacterium]|nr:ATP synthase F1 subunit gamma [Oscillospiraceae bacterium]
MSDITDLRQRLSAVAQTRQITNAMYLMSSTRMRRETQRVRYAKEYFTRLRSAVLDIRDNARGITHPYLDERTGERSAFLVVAGDKGLCGSYNHDVLDFALGEIKKRDARFIETVGRMATLYLRRNGIEPDVEDLGAAHQPTLRAARSIVENLFRFFDDGSVDKVYIIFTRFINAAKSQPVCLKLLPLDLDAFSDIDTHATLWGDVLYEPSPEAVFDSLVPQCAIGLVFAALVQSSASEHSARMNAMRAATDNADEISRDLQHKYQTLRQLSITNEIIEITSGAEGIKQGSEAENQ